MGPHELWDEPWEGLPEEEAPWERELIDEQENGSTKNPPDGQRGWKLYWFSLNWKIRFVELASKGTNLALGRWHCTGFRRGSYGFLFPVPLGFGGKQSWQGKVQALA